ncbi:replicative DNA helicase [uncultured Tyzzerella sp.]|uniref:replicative DNA helicase n=1 Tax=uncultured Tyzzerella sp. TaxID=2321398 RepID=UPI00294293F6|nr:replicative DNA helicase [uncultured Tyzzerella sp.]
MAEINPNINPNINPEIPPNDFEAEQAVLSCMIFDIDGISIAYEMLKAEDFYRPEHKILFEAMISMYSNSHNVDVITLKNKLEAMDMLNNVGGYEYIIELYNIVSTSALTKQYADIVKEKSIRRKILKASKDINVLTFDNTETIENIVEKVEKIVDNIGDNSNLDDFSPISKVLETSIENIENLFRNKSKVTGIETGFVDFDMKTSGLQNSDFILIAGRPSMGKTAFVINIAQHAALHKNVTTAIFSLEMSKEQLVNRMICTEALVDAQKLRTGDIQSDDWYKIAEAVSALSDAPIYIDDKSAITIPELRAKCRRLKKEKNLGLVVIDYLQLMNGSGKNENRQQEISNISRSLKGLARELNVPIVALSQLSRAVEQRKPPKPMLSDLRESGAIEQDADLVCFLYREEYYNPETEKRGQAEVIIAKQRNGSVGTVNLSWLGQYTKFANLERTYNDL